MDVDELDHILRDFYNQRTGSELRDLGHTLGAQLMAKHLCVAFRSGMIQYLLTFNDPEVVLREFLAYAKKKTGNADNEERDDDGTNATDD